MKSIGIMQGRLTEPKGRGIQFFPFEEWKSEFYRAKELGLNEIEWIFDYPDYEQNPLWFKEGVDEIKKVIEDTGVVVNSVCLDYFMRRSFYKFNKFEKEEILEENKKIIKNVLETMKAIGAYLIEIPMVDESSIKNEEEEEAALSFVQWVCDIGAECGITVGLETDFPPIVFKKFLDRINKENIVANYDSGNSSGLGYDHREELISLGKYVYNVHIKDRLLGNGTVELGTGSADFDAVFDSLKKIGYRNSFILQAARGNEGEEAKIIRNQITFVEKYLKKYEMEW